MSQDNHQVPDDLISREELYNKLYDALKKAQDKPATGDSFFSSEYNDGYIDAHVDVLDLLSDWVGPHYTLKSFDKPLDFKDNL